MRLFLGVDGGQSDTTALIGDEAGRVLGKGQGGPCNHVGAAEGRAKLTGAVTECVAKACAQAQLDPAQVLFEAACFGMSGGPEDKEALLSEILRAGKLVLTHDGTIALAGATGGEPGIATIAGTGSIVFGRAADGRTARAGGWGYLFGDEGGAIDIARQALRAALRFEEGWGPSTFLRAALLQSTGAASANDVLHLFYTSAYPRPAIAALARLVDEAVRRQLWRPGERALVAYIGGVFRSELLLERFRLLVELEEGNHCQPPLYGPEAGALLEAYRAAGLHPKLRLPESE
jgi:N-acetylglucosamine kinase-like BadF-type ATPase